MFSDAAVAYGHPIRRFRAAQPHAGACAGRDGAAGAVRMSELFGGGDPLMIYHYMFPRHSQDDRPGPRVGETAKLPLTEGPCPSCTALIDVWEGGMPHLKGWAAIHGS